MTTQKLRPPRPPSKEELAKMNEEAHEAIARLASVDLGNPMERILARTTAKRLRVATWLATQFKLDVSEVEASLLAYEEQETLP